MNKIKYCLIYASIVSMSTFAEDEKQYSQSVEIKEYVESILLNRTGSASIDRRKDVKVLGAKVGCRGDTLTANVKINTVQTEVQGKTSIVTLTYTGNYVRQGWDVPCVTVSRNLNGVEERNLAGTFSFKLTPKLYKKPAISDGKFSNFQEIGSPTHDSNVVAMAAVESIVNSAF